MSNYADCRLNSQRYCQHDGALCPLEGPNSVCTMRDPLSRTFTVLAEPTRRSVPARLSEGEANVPRLSEAEAAMA